MNNRRQMYYRRNSAMRNVPYENNNNMTPTTTEPVVAASDNDSVDCTSCGECPPLFGHHAHRDQCNECIMVNDMPGFALAMAYVPWQTFRNLYNEHDALCNGTIFKELNLEYRGRRCN